MADGGGRPRCGVDMSSLAALTLARSELTERSALGGG
jgi:hypothetical protein